MPSIRLERYPGLPPLFLDFARGRSPLYPDPPTIEAAGLRGREILAQPGRVKLSPEAYRFRGDAGRKSAEDLAAGRAVAVLAGHQVGILTGPLYTLVKAFDAIVLARELRLDPRLPHQVLQLRRVKPRTERFPQAVI